MVKIVSALGDLTAFALEGGDLCFGEFCEECIAVLVCLGASGIVDGFFCYY